MEFIANGRFREDLSLFSLSLSLYYYYYYYYLKLDSTFRLERVPVSSLPGFSLV